MNEKIYIFILKLIKYFKIFSVYFFTIGLVPPIFTMEKYNIFIGNIIYFRKIMNTGNWEYEHMKSIDHYKNSSAHRKYLSSAIHAESGPIDLKYVNTFYKIKIHKYKLSGNLQLIY